MAEQHYRVVIAYKGRDYFGWQYLGDAGEKPTVQFEILKALRKISKYETCQVAGASPGHRSHPRYCGRRRV